MSPPWPGPNTFLCGVPKAGTTALTLYLGQHPDVFLPADWEPNRYLFRSEPPNDVGPAPPRVVQHMLLRASALDEATFRQSYEPGAGHAVRVDGSVRYLYHPAALEAIRDEQPLARHIVVLRDPVERIISHWRMNRQFHLEPLPVADALAAEDARVRAGWGWDWHYRRVSTYAPQLERLYELFPREQVHVVLYGDLVRHPERVVAACLEHLGLEDSAPIDLSIRAMVPTEAMWPWLDRLLVWPTRTRGLLDRLPADVGQRIVGGVRRRNCRAPAAPDLRGCEDLSSWFEEDAQGVARLLGMPVDELRAGMAGSRRQAGAGAWS